ncbi:OprO/OprP family phosphate-selective porin [Acidithiobacillus sp. YTS05]|nr:OprO/OprP family phosphate-selective porin [Acidithiobacillus sp. YTS05]
MKKNLVAFAVAAAVLVPGAAFAADSSAKDNGPILYGYAQITGSNQFGTSTNGSQSGPNGLVIGANRIRLGVKGEATDGVTYNIMAGWDNAAISGNNANNQSIPGYSTNALNNGLGNGGNASILDAWINFAPVPFVQLEVGKFKQPVGNEYIDTQGNALPFILRSMGQSLLPGRSAGAMLHAKDVMGTGIGYAFAIADDSSLDYGSAYNWGLGTVSNPFGGGQGGFLNGSGRYIASARLTYDFMGPLLNAEVSGSRMTLPENSIYNADSMTTWNVGVHGGLMGIHYVAGYTNLNTGESRNGLPGFLAQDWNVGLALNLYQMTLTPSWLDIEPAVRFDSFSYNDRQGYDAKLDNTTVGLNYYVNPNNPHAAEIQVNYIIPTARNGNFGVGTPGGVFGGNGAPINGMAYNTLMLQFQAGF